jgi:hypothetical protein
MTQLSETPLVKLLNSYPVPDNADSKIDVNLIDQQLVGMLNDEERLGLTQTGHDLLAAVALWDALPEPSPVELHQYQTQAVDKSWFISQGTYREALQIVADVLEANRREATPCEAT